MARVTGEDIKARLKVYDNRHFAITLTLEEWNILRSNTPAPAWLSWVRDALALADPKVVVVLAWGKIAILCDETVSPLDDIVEYLAARISG